MKLPPLVFSFNYTVLIAMVTFLQFFNLRFLCFSLTMDNASSKTHEFDDKEEVDTPTVRVEFLPELVPDVENLLKRCLAQEVELYLSNAQGKKCELCPFRAFSRVGRVQGHLQGLPGVGVYPGGVKPRPRFLAPVATGS